MNTFDPDALECLAAIVQEGGFERAAVRLSITQSAVSQRLRSLESQAGMVLIVRSRPVKPTPAGQLLLKHTKMQRLLRADLERELRELAPNMAPGVREHERIAIAINADSIASWALPALNALACQGLPIEVIADDQDLTLQWLREGQVLGCVTALRQPLRGCRVVELGAMEYVAVVSRDFAIGQRGSSGAGGPLLGMHNFRHLPFVAFNRKDGMPELFVAQALGLKSVNLQQFFVPSCQGMVSAVLAGWGSGFCPDCWFRRCWSRASCSTPCPVTVCACPCTGIAGTCPPRCSTASVPRCRLPLPAPWYQGACKRQRAVRSPLEDSDAGAPRAPCAQHWLSGSACARPIPGRAHPPPRAQTRALLGVSISRRQSPHASGNGQRQRPWSKGDAKQRRQSGRTRHVRGA